MVYRIAHLGDGRTEQVLRDAIGASTAPMELVAGDAPADVVVLDAQDAGALVAAAEVHRRTPSAQIVLLAPESQVDRLRAHLAFVPHVASAWVAATSTAPAGLASLLGKAASASARRHTMQALRDRINEQLKPAIEPGDEVEQHRRRQLELSERYLSTLLAQAPQAFTAITPQGGIMAWNAAAERLFGIPAKAALGRRVAEVLPSRAAQELTTMVEQVLAEGGTISREAKLELEPATIWAQLSAASVLDEGRVASVSVTLQDVTRNHQVVVRLRESEARFRTLIQTLPQMIWTATPDGSCNYFSRQWLEYTGVDEAEQLGYGWLDRVVHPDDRERTRQHWLGAVEGKHPYDVDYRIRGVEGSYRWFKLRGTPIHAEDGSIQEWFGSATDIQDSVVAREMLAQNAARLSVMVEKEMARRTTAEQALHRAQKMEAIGNLTGGIAHDFNNILQVIQGNLQLLSGSVAQDERATRRVRNALEGVDRGSKLAAQLLAFGRRQPLAPKVINIGRFVREMDDMLRRTLGERIELETSIAGGLWNTLVDPSNIESALLNLTLNARDAMHGEGRLTIEVGNAFLDHDYADGQDDVEPGQYVMLAVTDTGSGMPPEIIDKVFEPFFTTKPEGKGTGLGLSMVYGFVKQSAGHIKIYSEPGQGTTFKIYLPRSYESEDALVGADERPVRGGSETVLVVEDDDAVRDTVVSTLGNLGYSVLKARDAEAALSIIESGLHIDLLFTDVVMPGPLKSPELVRKARQRLPQLAVLYTSGYTQNAIVHGGRLDEGVELLSKPYSREALARRFRHVLANAAQRAAGASAPTSAAERAAGEGATVLLCEDDPMIRAMLGELLELRGYRVLSAASGEEALRQAGEHGCDLLITDLSLPDMSGLELAARLREKRPGCPLVFATGRPEDLPGDLEDAVTVSKPFEPGALYGAIGRALGR